MAVLFPRMTSIMEQNRQKDVIAFVLGIFLLGFLIQLAGWIKNDRLVFPDVPEILWAFLKLLSAKKTYLIIASTLGRLLLVILSSSVMGILLGILTGRSDLFRSLLEPTLILLRSIPMIVMVVIVMVLTRYERVPLIVPNLFLIPLISEAVCEGYRHIDPELIDVYRLNGSFGSYVLFHVHLPLMSGYLKQAYVNAVGMGIKLIVSAEYLVQTRNSLGKAVNSSAYFNEYQDIYAYALIMILLVLFVSAIPEWVDALIQRFLGRSRPVGSSGEKEP